jgi:hypothetical protein
MHFTCGLKITGAYPQQEPIHIAALLHRSHGCRTAPVRGPTAPAPRRRAQVGCGADELIDLLMRCTLDPGDKIIDCPPTFTMYVFDADINDARTITVPRLEGFRNDVEGIRCDCVCVGGVGVGGQSKEAGAGRDYRGRAAGVFAECEAAGLGHLHHCGSR